MTVIVYLYDFLSSEPVYQKSRLLLCLEVGIVTQDNIAARHLAAAAAWFLEMLLF